MHHTFVDAFNESQKRACTDEDSWLQHLTRAMEGASSTMYSQHNYLQIKYWYKVSLKTKKKGTSDVGSGTCRGTRLANGKNIMHFYIENIDRTSVDGSVVTAMQEDARSIWESFSR